MGTIMSNPEIGAVPGGQSNGAGGPAPREAHQKAARVASEKEANYNTGRPASNARTREQEDIIVEQALAILDMRMFRHGEALTSPRDSAAFLKLKLGGYQWEVFGCLFLDNRHRVLAFEEMFRGTLDGASVHPREVVRAALHHNAAAVILSHNHPSGVPEPSAADRNITRQLRDALQLIGVRVLDHLVIGAGEPTSMAARGLI
jgi:DNA repair protein RadC